ncbi:MAG: tetratricopeptide repeat protein [Polyangia bacterium]
MTERRPKRALMIAGAVISVALTGVFLHGRTSGAGMGTRPYTPTSDDVVVEQRGRPSRDAAASQRAALRQALAERPADDTLATQLARLEIEEARRRSDPRHLGYAQAALQPWWHTQAPPVGVLVLRATIRQSRHEFQAARADLDQAVHRAPDNAQAWLTRSTVLSVLGLYEGARVSCEPLRRLTSILVAEVCFAAVDGVTGSAQSAATRLNDALAKASPDDDRGWALSVLADLDAVRGHPADAETHLRAALAANADDSYSRGALADLLLDTGRYGEAISVVDGREQNDGLLLRMAIAEHAAGSPKSGEHASELASRFQASRVRGDQLHGREEARFELMVRGNPPRALELARANWATQHEPADARILLEAAAAVGSSEAAGPVLQWLAETHNEDGRLALLAGKLRQSARSAR